MSGNLREDLRAAIFAALLAFLIFLPFKHSVWSAQIASLEASFVAVLQPTKIVARVPQERVAKKPKIEKYCYIVRERDGLIVSAKNLRHPKNYDLRILDDLDEFWKKCDFIGNDTYLHLKRLAIASQRPPPRRQRRGRGRHRKR